MKGLWKIIKIILVFFLALTLISWIWYSIEIKNLEKGENVTPFIDFVLYLLGFSDLTLKNHYLQTIFSTLGLFSVTLLSSVFTVNLFELRRKVKIDSKITVCSPYSAKLKFRTSKKDIYNLTATLITKCNNQTSTEVQYFPFISKNTTQEIFFDIKPGAVLYKYLRAIYFKSLDTPQLIVTISYTDIESGQEYTMARKFQYSTNEKKQIIFTESDNSVNDDTFETKVRKNIENNIFPINLTSILPCNAEDIDISYECFDNQTPICISNVFNAKVHMNNTMSYNYDSFTMAYTKDLIGNNWLKFYDLGCVLKFDYKIDENIVLTVQLKCTEKNTVAKEIKLYRNNDFETFTLKLNTLKPEDLSFVSELCFTVFYRDVNKNNPNGNFSIKNCVLEVEQ